MNIPAMHTQGQPMGIRLQRAVESGELGLWDLRVDLETVHYSPQWKLRLGFPDPHGADSTHFWRCRVHPEDLDTMLAAMRAHARGIQPMYEATFRLRSNGSGYRLVHSRGRVIERGAEDRAIRMVGTMIDLTERPFTPRGGLPDGPRGPMAGSLFALPFHVLLGGEPAGAAMGGTQTVHATAERRRVLGLVDDVLQASLAQLDGLRKPAPSA